MHMNVASTPYILVHKIVSYWVRNSQWICHRGLLFACCVFMLPAMIMLLHTYMCTISVRRLVLTCNQASFDCRHMVHIVNTWCMLLQVASRQSREWQLPRKTGRQQGWCTAAVHCALLAELVCLTQQLASLTSRWVACWVQLLRIAYKTNQHAWLAIHLWG